MKVPGKEDGGENYKTRRFVDGYNMENQNLNNLFNAGLKWNDDVYCVPPELKDSVEQVGETTNVLFINC